MGNLDSIEVDDMLELWGLDNVERQCVSGEEVEEVVGLLVFQGVPGSVWGEAETPGELCGNSVETLWRLCGGRCGLPRQSVLCVLCVL